VEHLPDDIEDAPPEFQVPVPSELVVAGHPEASVENPFEDIPEAVAVDVGDEPDADPAGAFRRVLGMFATGVTIITTQAGGQVHGMTANAFMSVSLRPPLVVVAVDRRARMHRLLHVGRTYGVNVLGEHQGELSDHFAGRRLERAPDPVFQLIRDTPLVQGAIAHLVARVVKTYWGGDHALFLGQVEYARWDEGEPLLFHGGRYESLRAAVPLFSSLSPELLESILAAGVERSYEAGEVVFSAGDRGEELYVILEGSARIERAGRPPRRLGKGEFFGEVAVLDGRPRTADVIADEPLRCLTVSRDVLREALAREPRAGWAVLGVLAGRVRDAC
jgi:flavin reductase (DIM6/NTAB) family NADH-FMN oxidoreductase RutF